LSSLRFDWNVLLDTYLLMNFKMKGDLTNNHPHFRLSGKCICGGGGDGESGNPRRVLEGRKLPTSRDMLEFLESEA